MIEVTVLFLVAPAFLGLLAGRSGQKGNAQGFAIFALCALIPAFIMLALAQQADAITASAAWQMTPTFVAFMFLPAGIGFAVGRNTKRTP